MIYSKQNHQASKRIHKDGKIGKGNQECTTTSGGKETNQYIILGKGGNKEKGTNAEWRPTEERMHTRLQ